MGAVDNIAWMRKSRKRAERGTDQHPNFIPFIRSSCVAGMGSERSELLLRGVERLRVC